MGKQVDFRKMIAALHRKKDQDMSELCQRWEEELRGRVKPSTMIRYETICNLYILPMFWRSPVQSFFFLYFSAFILLYSLKMQDFYRNLAFSNFYRL